MTVFYRKSDGTEVEHNFIAPSGTDDLTREVLFPIGEVQAPDYAATIEVDVLQMATFVQPAELTGALTLNLDIDDQVSIGARLHLKFTADDQGAKTVTLGTGFDALAANIVVPNDGFIFASFEYDGTSFVPVSFDEADSRLDAIESDVSTAEGDIDDLEAAVTILEGSESQTPAYGATLAVTIDKQQTFLQPAELTGNATINLTIDEDVIAGAMLHLKLDADASNRTVTLGTGFAASLASLVVVASTVWTVSFVYDGTSFICMDSRPAA